MSTQFRKHAVNTRRSSVSMLALALLAACSGAAQATPYVMFRDPQCGCCEEWAKHVRSGLEHAVTVREDRPMTQVKAQAGIPGDLRSCHTMEVGKYVIEGHVPSREIARLLAEQPTDVRGLAVAGMPLGSPGMDATGQKQPFEVIAFGPNGRKIYASYR